MITRKQFAKWLRQRMAATGTTQDKIVEHFEALKVPITQQAVSHWVNGKYYPKSSEHRKILCELFDATHEEMFDEIMGKSA